MGYFFFENRFCFDLSSPFLISRLLVNPHYLAAGSFEQIIKISIFFAKNRLYLRICLQLKLFELQFR